MHGKSAAPPPQSESDTNRSPRRADGWRNLDAATRALVAEDARWFLRQSVSTPCLDAIAKAEGIWIEDIAGRRYMDFHGNNVHHIGYGHPRLMEAIKPQLDELPLRAAALRQRAGGRAGRDAGARSRPAGLAQGAVHHRRLGRDRGRPQAARAPRPGASRRCSFWDAFHGAGFGAAERRRRGAVPLAARSARCSPAPSTWRRSAAIAAPTAIPTATASRRSSSASSPAPRWCATCWSAKATWRP